MEMAAFRRRLQRWFDAARSAGFDDDVIDDLIEHARRDGARGQVA